MSQVNLLPPEIRQRQTTRRTTFLVALGGVVVLVAIGFFYFLQTLNLSRAQDDLAAQQAKNADLQGQIAVLAEFGTLQAQLQQRQDLITTVFANEVAWSGVLLDVSRIIPSNAFLSSLTGQIIVPTGTGPAGAAPAPGETAGLIGNITFEGSAAEINTVAEWLARLDQVRGWVNAWLTQAQETEAGSRDYTFSSGIDLTNGAVTNRGGGRR